MFPHPFLADSDGLLAFSDNLSVDQLLLSYQFGIFPWNNEDEPICWWFPHPRCVLFPEKLKVSKSMKSLINKGSYHCSINQAFEEVISSCQLIKRKDQPGTWITDAVKKAFIELHTMGYAHSVEVWEEEQLIGGLYGLALGTVFFGESMFSKKSNASKFGFIFFVQFLANKGFTLIDCQQETTHLMSLGAELMSQENFFAALRNNIFADQIHLR